MMRFTDLNLAGRAHLKPTPTPQVIPTYMTNESFGFCLFLFFFILTKNCGNANKVVETQSVPYLVLYIIKKIASSILFPKSLL